MLYHHFVANYRVLSADGLVKFVFLNIIFHYSELKSYLIRSLQNCVCSVFIFPCLFNETLTIFTVVRKSGEDVNSFKKEADEGFQEVATRSSCGNKWRPSRQQYYAMECCYIRVYFDIIHFFLLLFSSF